MRFATSILIILCLLATSGCCTTELINNHAKPHDVEVSDATKEHPANGHLEHVDGQPAYYALVPFTVVADIVTSPFQLFLYLVVTTTGDGP